MDEYDLELIEDAFDHTHLLKKMGVGSLYWYTSWCGPWCCERQPRREFHRPWSTRWKRKANHGRGKNKTLRSHRT